MSTYQSHAQQANEFKISLTNGKKKYNSPGLVCYGSVSVLTQAGTMGGNEANNQDKSNMAANGSDIRLKQDIVLVGKHPLGFGLYLFDYKAEFSELHGSGRHFGVMAQEVEAVVPDAVSTNADGYKRVNYAMLGMSLTSGRVH